MKFAGRSLMSIAVVTTVSFAGAFGCASPDPVLEAARGEVVRLLKPGASERVTSNSLRAKTNPAGDGVLVSSDASTNVQQFVWVVIDGEVAAVNGPSKNATPRAVWPRDIDSAIWSRTGLDPYSAARTIQLAMQP